MSTTTKPTKAAPTVPDAAPDAPPADDANAAAIADHEARLDKLEERIGQAEQDAKRGQLVTFDTDGDERVAMVLSGDVVTGEGLTVVDLGLPRLHEAGATRLDG